MKKNVRFKKLFGNLEPEGQGRDIIVGVTRLLLLGPFYTIQTNFMYFFSQDCKKNFVMSYHWLLNLTLDVEMSDKLLNVCLNLNLKAFSNRMLKF